MLRTTINRTWLFKMLAFTLVLGALGLWGFFDAAIAYPNRGQKHANWTEREYLSQAEDSGLTLQAPVPDPHTELARLQAARDDLERERTDAAAAGRTRIENAKTTELRRLDWLTALSRISKLKPEHTDIQDPRARLEELNTELERQNPPKPLAAYDLPFQWLICAAGVLGALYCLSLIFLVSRKKFAYDPESHTLTIPGGRTITPAQIDLVDKRKWHKFFATFRMKEGAPVKLDLLRYQPLEEWVLEMEKKTDNYEPPKEEDPAQNETENNEESAPAPD